MKQGRRPQKVASFIKEEVSQILMYELDDPVFKNFISITDVKVSGDLRRAQIFFRVFQGDPEEVKQALDKAKGYIRKLLAERMNIRFVPEISFEVDRSFEEEQRLAELFRRIKKEEGNEEV
jgi:ribosome-binding factor A